MSLFAFVEEEIDNEDDVDVELELGDDSDVVPVELVMLFSVPESAVAEEEEAIVVTVAALKKFVVDIDC